MKILPACILSLTILLKTIWTSTTNPIRNVRCSINGTNHFEVIVNDVKNEVSVNCRNGNLDIKQLVECAKIRSIDLLSARSCTLHASLSTTLLHDMKRLSLINIFTEDIFFISNLAIEFLFIHKATMKELHLENLLLLKHLVIMSMDWETISGKPFQNLERLQVLSLTHNQLEYLEEDVFDHLRKLLILNLSNNKLQTVPQNLFKNMESLNYVLMEKNRFTYLNSSTFSKLKSLTHLTISGNMLREIPEELLASNLELKHISLSHNLDLKEIPEKFFNNTRKLLSLDVSNCGLGSLPVNVFKTCPLMKKISLSNNRLEIINADTFFSLSLSFLDLSKNSLTSLPSNLFNSSHRLQYLNLSQNHFIRIPANAFTDTFFLTELNLNFNDIEVVNIQDFDSLTNLLKLDLGSNKIQFLNSLGKAESLLFLNLSSNSIEIFPKVSWRSYKVKSIDLSNNDIKDLPIVNLSFKAVATLNLQHNRITSIHLNHTIQNPLILYLGFNPFVCDCLLRNFVQFIQKTDQSMASSIIVADANNLSCNSPITWKNETLIQITPSHLCPIYNACPISCRCYQLQDFKVLVNCSSLGMTIFPIIFPSNTSIVHLENNFISDFHTLTSKVWTGLTHVYLDRNELIAPQTLTPPTSLKLLTLRYNNITSLPDDFLKFISNASSFMLDIRDNPWTCNCSLLSFKRWFMKNLNKMIHSEDVLCTRLVNQTIVLSTIQETPEDAFCTPSFQADKTIQIALATTLSLMSLLIIVLIVFYYRYNETVLAYIYVHIPLFYCCKLSNVDRNKHYDAFISYTGSDRDTVLAIVDELETKPPYFKLCIHERDWLAGYPIISQIETSVGNSKKTIVILTKNFIESFWCETEFQTAYMQSLEDRIDRIIIVIKGDLPERETMPLDIQNLLASKTYLVWGERWFWEKLRYALPYYATSVRSTDIGKVEEVEGMISNLMQRKSSSVV